MNVFLIIMVKIKYQNEYDKNSLSNIMNYYNISFNLDMLKIYQKIK